MLEKSVIRVGIDSQDFLRDANKSRQALGRLGRQAGKTSAQFEALKASSGRTSQQFRTLRTSTSKTSKQFKSLHGAAGLLRASLVSLGTIGAVSLFKKAITSAANFEQKMLEVATLVDTSTFSMKNLTKAVRDNARKFGTGHLTNAAAAYQIVSAGASSAAEATELLTAANKLAIAGMTDVETAADGLTSVLNAYGLTAERAISVSDTFFVAVRAGKTTVDELSAAIGRVSPLAATAGVSINELFSALAVLTKSGLSTSEAVTALRGLLQSLVKPSKESAKLAKTLGLRWDTASLKSKGLVVSLKELWRVTGGNAEIFAALIPSIEGTSGAMILAADDAADLTEVEEAMKKKTGETQTAFDKMKESVSQLARVFREELADALIRIGNEILPGVVTALQYVNENFKSIAISLKDVFDAFAFASYVYIFKTAMTALFGWVIAARASVSVMSAQLGIIKNIKKFIIAIIPHFFRATVGRFLIVGTGLGLLFKLVTGQLKKAAQGGDTFAESTNRQTEATLKQNDALEEQLTLLEKIQKVKSSLEVEKVVVDNYKTPTVEKEPSTWFMKGMEDTQFVMDKIFKGVGLTAPDKILSEYERLIVAAPQAFRELTRLRIEASRGAKVGSLVKDKRTTFMGEDKKGWLEAAPPATSLHDRQTNLAEARVREALAAATVRDTEKVDYTAFWKASERAKKVGVKFMQDYKNRVEEIVEEIQMVLDRPGYRFAPDKISDLKKLIGMRRELEAEKIEFTLKGTEEQAERKGDYERPLMDQKAELVYRQELVRLAEKDVKLFEDMAALEGKRRKEWERLRDMRETEYSWGVEARKEASRIAALERLSGAAREKQLKADERAVWTFNKELLKVVAHNENALNSALGLGDALWAGADAASAIAYNIGDANGRMRVLQGMIQQNAIQTWKDTINQTPAVFAGTVETQLGIPKGNPADNNVDLEVWGQAQEEIRLHGIVTEGNISIARRTEGLKEQAAATGGAASATNDLVDALNSEYDTILENNGGAVASTLTWYDETKRQLEELGYAWEDYATIVDTILGERMQESMEKDLQHRTDWGAGLQRGMNTIEAQVGTSADMMENALVSVWSKSSDALADFVMTGKLDFASLARSIIADIIKMIAKWLVFTLLKTAFGGFFGEGGLALGGGGAVPGLASGGLANNILAFPQGGPLNGPGTETSDSILARLSHGEFVVNAKSTRQNLPLLKEINAPKFAEGGSVGKEGGRGVSRGNVVNINISTPDARSFVESEQQVTNSIRRAVSRGGRSA